MASNFHSFLGTTSSTFLESQQKNPEEVHRELKNGLVGFPDNSRFTVQPSGDEILEDVVLEPVMQMFAHVLTV